MVDPSPGELAMNGGRPVRGTPLPSTADARGRTIGDEEIAAAVEVLKSGSLNRHAGSTTSRFEDASSLVLGLPHCVASTSGTAAIHLAIGAVDPAPGDEVITTPLTDFGTIIPILLQNAVPVFADVDPETFCLDPADVEKKITARTRAIIAVHLFGQPAPLSELRRIATEHGLLLIEDCSQAYLAETAEGVVGTTGDIACYSLQQSKHITTGDGGLSLTADSGLANRMRLFADKAWPRDAGQRTHLFLSPNYRMTEVTAAIGIAQLAKLPGVVSRRRDIADVVDGVVIATPGMRPARTRAGDRSSYWLYSFLLDSQSSTTVAVAEALVAEGIPATAGYVDPMYLTPVLRDGQTYAGTGFPFRSVYAQDSFQYGPGLCPVAETMRHRVVTIPINERYTSRDVDDIVTSIAKVGSTLLHP